MLITRPLLPIIMRFNTVQRCQLLADALKEKGHSTIPRPIFDKLLARGYGIGAAQIRNLVKTGEDAQYWTRVQHIGNQPGSITLS